MIQPDALGQVLHDDSVVLIFSGVSFNSGRGHCVD